MRRKNLKNRPPLPNQTREAKIAFGSNRMPTQIYQSVAAPTHLRQKDKGSKGILPSYMGEQQ